LAISLMLIPCSFMALNICQSSAVSAFTISSMKIHGVVNIQWPFLDTFQWPKMGKFEWAITQRSIGAKECTICLFLRDSPCFSLTDPECFVTMRE
ncbi:MAG: hypothetical protein M1166_01305, partial [Candidatus Thermoplasmatota archaeon]|nr:hypothetical protein [Candidatus Thermoplasmatota archaeon]